MAAAWRACSARREIPDPWKLSLADRSAALRALESCVRRHDTDLLEEPQSIRLERAANDLALVDLEDRQPRARDGRAESEPDDASWVVIFHDV